MHSSETSSLDSSPPPSVIGIEPARLSTLPLSDPVDPGTAPASTVSSAPCHRSCRIPVYVKCGVVAACLIGVLFLFVAMAQMMLVGSLSSNLDSLNRNISTEIGDAVKNIENSKPTPRCIFFYIYFCYFILLRQPDTDIAKDIF